eukprot:scaffold74191_cov72-Phaeocystis_antarctica.AAC.2
MLRSAAGDSQGRAAPARACRLPRCVLGGCVGLAREAEARHGYGAVAGGAAVNPVLHILCPHGLSAQRVFLCGCS